MVQPGNDDDVPPAKESHVARIPRSALSPPPSSPAFRRLYPAVEECLRCIVTSKGKPRAGAEVKILAKGQWYVATLIMPEEGKQIAVTLDDPGRLWEALERAMTDEAPAWVPCSSFARKRALIKIKDDTAKDLTTRDDPW
jgi:hypothetical protein